MCGEVSHHSGNHYRIVRRILIKDAENVQVLAFIKAVLERFYVGERECHRIHADTTAMPMPSVGQEEGTDIGRIFSMVCSVLQEMVTCRVPMSCCKGKQHWCVKHHAIRFLELLLNDEFCVYSSVRRAREATNPARPGREQP